MGGTAGAGGVSVGAAGAAETGDLDPARSKALSQQALRALEGGKYAACIELAQQAVAADPADANNYLYWGTALMSLGKRAEAKEAFSACVDKATRGPKHECRQFR